MVDYDHADSAPVNEIQDMVFVQNACYYSFMNFANTRAYFYFWYFSMPSAEKG
jgi:hypothetical protein